MQRCSTAFLLAPTHPPSHPPTHPLKQDWKLPPEHWAAGLEPAQLAKRLRGGWCWWSCPCRGSTGRAIGEDECAVSSVCGGKIFAVAGGTLCGHAESPAGAQLGRNHSDAPHSACTCARRARLAVAARWLLRPPPPPPPPHPPPASLCFYSAMKMRWRSCVPMVSAERMPSRPSKPAAASWRRPRWLLAGGAGSAAAAAAAARTPGAEPSSGGGAGGHGIGQADAVKALSACGGSVEDAAVWLLAGGGSGSGSGGALRGLTLVRLQSCEPTS